MIIFRGTDRVGSWTFMANGRGPNVDAAARWDGALAAVGHVGRCLEEAGLMVPPLAAQLRLGDATTYLNPVAVQATSRDELVEQTMHHLVAAQSSFGCLEIDGRTEVVSGSGERRLLPDAIGVDCTVETFGTAITLWTRSDVWLPFTLTAQPQAAVAAANAPRLRAALEAIEAIVGQPGYGEDTRFAHIDGYELRNHHVRGEILDLQDMGYDESWIAERWPEPEPA